ncbi:hypothetical protein F4818DRAFT_435938 [Hypoxylon cercidicola]|nr:hypothetical protein F4818DRAFT_435938 [Hypoxylon cercidicola]
MVYQFDSTEESSPRTFSGQFTPSSEFTSSTFGDPTTQAGRPLSEILSSGPSTQSSQSTRPARPRFFSSPRQDNNSRPSPRFSRRPQSQLSPPVSSTFLTHALQDQNFQAGNLSAAPSPQSRRVENHFWVRTPQKRQAVFFDNLPSRPTPKRKSLFSPDILTAMGDSKPASQLPTDSKAFAMPSILKSGTQPTQSSKDSSRTPSPEKHESPARTQSAPGLHTGWRPSKSYIDPDGDLCLEVGFVSAEFVVDSKMLARASPAWKKLVDGVFAEDKKAEAQDGKPERVLKLPDDNHAAMEIFLNIIHGRFDRVSGYEEFVYCVYLYSLCVLTDKYDMTRILRPWAKGWSRTVHANCDKLGDSLRTKFCHERLWIAWELGDHVSFEKIAETLLLESSSSSGYSLKYVGALEPPDIYGNISKTRLHMIESLLDAVRTIIEGLIQNRESMVKCPEEKADCVPSVLGKAIQSLHRVGLWPLPDPKAVKCSVTSLGKTLRLIDFGDSGGPETGEITLSHTCSQRFQSVMGEMIDVTLTSIPSVLSKAHRNHLADQAAKSGFAVNLSAKP